MYTPTSTHFQFPVPSSQFRTNRDVLLSVWACWRELPHFQKYKMTTYEVQISRFAKRNTILDKIEMGILCPPPLSTVIHRLIHRSLTLPIVNTTPHHTTPHHTTPVSRSRSLVRVLLRHGFSAHGLQCTQEAIVLEVAPPRHRPQRSEFPGGFPVGRFHGRASDRGGQRQQPVESMGAYREVTNEVISWMHPADTIDIISAEHRHRVVLLYRMVAD